MLVKCADRVIFDKSWSKIQPKTLSNWAVSMNMHTLSLEPPKGSPKCSYYTDNSRLFTHLCAPSGKWWSLKTILACQILYQILQGHSRTQFAEKNKELLLIVLLFDQTAALHLCQFIRVNIALQHIQQASYSWVLHFDEFFLMQINSFCDWNLWHLS